MNTFLLIVLVSLPFIAIAATRNGSIDMFRTRIQHLNLEAATLDDLSDAYQRCKQLGYKLTRTIGQHPNDKELSFYVVTPSGFELEIGWDALTEYARAWFDYSEERMVDVVRAMPGGTVKYVIDHLDHSPDH